MRRTHIWIGKNVQLDRSKKTVINRMYPPPSRLPEPTLMHSESHNVDPREVAQFGALSAEWWDMEGPFAVRIALPRPSRRHP